VQNVVERVLNLLIYLLESPTPVTADDIRYTVQGYGEQSDEAFHRMFERDKDVLRSLGIPLKRQPMDVWEVDFGYSVDPDEYAMADPGLTEEERVALSVAARMVRVGGSHLGLDALMKLGGVERGGGLEPIGADLGPGADTLGELFGAIVERHPVEFSYKGQVRSLRPHGLSHRRGHWYLAGATGQGARVYRVERIEGLVVGSGTFPKPKGFDVRRVMDTQPWEAGAGELVEAQVRFSAEVAWWAARTLGVDEPAEGDQLTATIPVVNVDAFIGWVLSFGDAAEIIEPGGMRDELTSRVNAALEAVR
jgi:proteasome accessory factor B